MASEVTVWNKVMSSALAIPGVQVDRETFLRSELRQYCSKDELEKAISNPVDVLSEDRIDSLANSCINNHLLKVTSLSVVAGIPGGLAMAATIPADMAQYYWHTFVLAQKLAYLYGIPDLRDENGNLTETSQDMLTLFVGVMMGAAAANNAIKNVSKAFAVQVVKRLPQKALTKTVYYPIIKQVANIPPDHRLVGTYGLSLLAFEALGYLRICFLIPNFVHDIFPKSRFLSVLLYLQG